MPMPDCIIFVNFALGIAKQCNNCVCHERAENFNIDNKSLKYEY